MSKIFYDHLILIEEIIPQLEPLDSESRDELIGIIDATFHHQILDLILTHLPKIHHEDFLTRFHSAPHDETLLNYLEARIDKDIKTEIQSLAQKLKKEILSEIKKSQSHRK